MFALGCIQALRCNNNTCPTGITTQNPALIRGLHVPSKTERIYQFHRATIQALLEMLSAMGLEAPADVLPDHVFRRVDDMHVRSFAEIHEFLDSSVLVSGGAPNVRCLGNGTGRMPKAGVSSPSEAGIWRRNERWR